VKQKDAVEHSDTNNAQGNIKNEVHHLISNREIEALLENELKNTNKVEVAEKIEHFLNQNHIKTIILGTNSWNENLIDKAKDTHGKIIHAAFSNNSHNLFHGPQYRTYDPTKPSVYADNIIKENVKKMSKCNFDENELLQTGSSLGHDTELLNHQNESFRESYNKYLNDKSIKNFTNLSENKPLKWDSNVNHDNRYEVTGLKE
jgi:hypothetical protein